MRGSVGLKEVSGSRRWGIVGWVYSQLFAGWNNCTSSSSLCAISRTGARTSGGQHTDSEDFTKEFTTVETQITRAGTRSAARSDAESRGQGEMRDHIGRRLPGEALLLHSSAMLCCLTAMSHCYAASLLCCFTIEVLLCCLTRLLSLLPHSL